MKKNRKKIFLKKKGFSLVEVLITMSILAIGLTAVMLLMANNLKYSITSKNQIVASMLAQEGAELVQNLVDNGKINSSTDDDDYKLDYDDIELDNVANFKLYYKDSFFAHDSSGTDTKFYRKINITNDSDEEKITATISVSWNDSDIPTTCNIATKCLKIEAVSFY